MNEQALNPSWLSFVTAVAILAFAFRLMVAFLALPLGVLQFLAARSDSSRVPLWSFALNQVLLGLLLSAFLAQVTHVWVEAWSPSPSWFYALTGLATTYFVLGGNAYERRRQLSDSDSPQGPLEQSSARGAELGFLLALISFPVLYLNPSLVTRWPGATVFFPWAVRLAQWLASFWVVRLVTTLSILGYFLAGGLMLLMGGVAVVAGVFSLAAALFRRKPA